MAQLVADLDSDLFAVRQKATQALEDLGELAEAVLRKAREGQPSLEKRRRLDQLLEKLEKQPITAERLPSLPPVQVLDPLGTPEARKVLETVAGGAAEARLTREARRTLERLARRPGAAP